MKTLKDKVAVRRALSPKAAGTDNTAYVSEIIDTQGFESCMFAIAIGALTDADATFTVLVEDGDNSSLTDNAAVADSQLIGTEADASFQFDDDNETRTIEYIGIKRYVRLTITPANNAAGDHFIAAVAILSGARKAPAS